MSKISIEGLILSVLYGLGIVSVILLFIFDNTALRITCALYALFLCIVTFWKEGIVKTLKEAAHFVINLF